MTAFNAQRFLQFGGEPHALRVNSDGLRIKETDIQAPYRLAIDDIYRGSRGFLEPDAKASRHVDPQADPPRVIPYACGAPSGHLAPANTGLARTS
jgi:hypothetical protein